MIPNNFEAAFAQVKHLADNFQKGEKYYLSADYQEANVRQHFLDNFFCRARLGRLSRRAEKSI